VLTAAIIGHGDNTNTANLINSILSSTGKRISIIDSKSLIELDSQLFKNYIGELEKNGTDILILKINIKEVEKEAIDYLHFDIILYSDRADDLKETDVKKNAEIMRTALSLLDEKGIAIVNFDDSELMEQLQGLKNYVVTYGFNSKASITTSSIGDTLFKDSFICCQQKVIPAKNGLLIEPQEYIINLAAGEIDAYNVLAAATFAIVNGVDLNMINQPGAKV